MIKTIKKVLIGPLLVASLVGQESLFWEIADPIVNSEFIESYINRLIEVDKFEEVRKGLEESNVDFENAEISMIPSNSVKVEGKPAEHMLKMLDLLDDCDDVQKVHSNFDIDDSVIEALI